MRAGRRLDFFYQLMPGADHFLVDPVEDLGGEQTQIVLERLQRVARLVGPIAVPQHLANRRMLIGQFLDAVVVRIQPLTQGAQDQNLPLLHTRAAGVRVNLFLGAVFPLPCRSDFGEDREDPLADLRGHVDVLQATQDLRDVVAGFRVQLDGGDILLAELQLRIDDPAHDVLE